MLLNIGIFLSIFTLIRTVFSAFIKRYGPIVGGKVQSLKSVKGGASLPFVFDGRRMELFEVPYSEREGQKTVYNNILFLHSKCI